MNEKFRDRYESTNNNIKTFRIKKIMHLNNVLNILLIEKQNLKFKIKTIVFREIRRYQKCKVLALPGFWQRFFLTIAEAVRERILIA